MESKISKRKVDLLAYIKSAPNWIVIPIASNSRRRRPTAAGLQTSKFFGTNDAGRMAGLVCPFSSSLHILTPGISELGAGKNKFLVNQNIGSKKWRQAFLERFFVAGVLCLERKMVKFNFLKLSNNG